MGFSPLCALRAAGVRDAKVTVRAVLYASEVLDSAALTHVRRGHEANTTPVHLLTSVATNPKARSRRGNEADSPIARSASSPAKGGQAVVGYEESNFGVMHPTADGPRGFACPPWDRRSAYALVFAWGARCRRPFIRFRPCHPPSPLRPPSTRFSR